jgi:chromosome segregation protein
LIWRGYLGMPLKIKPPEPPQGWAGEKKKGFLKNLFAKKDDVAFEPSMISKSENEPIDESKYAPHKEAAKREMDQVDNLRRRLDHDIRERRAHLEIHEKDLDELRRELDDREKQIRRREKLMNSSSSEDLSDISKELLMKEKELLAKQQKLSVQEKELSDQKRVIEKLERDLRTKEELVKGKVAIAEQVKNDHSSRDVDLEKREEAIAGREVEVDVRIKKIRELERMYKSLNVKDLVAFDKLLHEKESVLSRKELDLKSEISIVKKKQAQVLEKSSMLNMRETNLDMKLRELARAKKLYNAKNLHLLAQKEKLIHEKERVLEKKEAHILKLEKDVHYEKAKAEKLNEKEGLLRKKELEINADRQVVDQQLKRYHKIISEREDLEMINTKLKKKEAILRKMESDIEQRMEYYQEIVDKSPEIQERIQFIMNKEKILDNMESELRVMAQALKDERNRNNLQGKEIEARMGAVELLNKKEEILAKKESLLQGLEVDVEEFHQNKGELIKYIEMLNKEKVLLENKYETFMEALSRLKDERDYNLKEVDHTLTRLEQDRETILPAVNRLDEEIKSLDEKEVEICKAVKEMETSKKLLEKEEERVRTILHKAQDVDKDIKAREKNIKVLEKTISKEENRLRTEVEKIEKAKHMKKEIPKLKRIYTKLKKDILKINEEAVAKRENLKDFESKLIEKEHALILKEKEVMATEARITNDRREWSKLEKVADSDKIYASIKTVEKLGKDLSPNQTSDVYGMIENARTLITSQKTQDAQALIDEIEKEFKKVKADEKRLVGYEIMELKNDLKLASLA